MMPKKPDNAPDLFRAQLSQILNLRHPLVRLVGKIPKKATRAARKWMKRRAAIEPTIGHLKSDHRLSRNYLRGRPGDRANVVLAAVGYNFAKLLAGFSRAWRKLREIHPCSRSTFVLRRPALSVA